jgi:phosphate acetyltransferase
VPIALTSRADGPARVASAVLAVLAAHDSRKQQEADAWKSGH